MRGVVCISLSIACAFVLGVSSAAPASDAQPTVTVIGDSVLTGVLWYPESLAILQQDLDVRMEVAVCRRLTGTSCTFEDSTPPTLVSLVQEKGASLGPTVLVVMGYNDSQRTFAASVEASIRALLQARVQRILWATLRAARHPYVEMNDVLFAAAGRHPEVTVVDWNKYSRSHPEWFQNDGLHVERVGGVALATFLHEAIVKALRSPLPLVLTTKHLPAAQVGRPYAVRLAARGGRPPYRWHVIGGSLPRGLRLAAGGRITGVPARRVRAAVSLRVVDADGRAVTRRHVLVVR